ncbi:aldehyde dehydrogenase iron-sulfur subunit, partial [Pseudomonas sp. FW305-76]
MQDLDSPRPSRRALLQAGAAASLLWVGGSGALAQPAPT